MLSLVAALLALAAAAAIVIRGKLAADELTADDLRDPLPVPAP